MTDCSCPDWANPCKHIAATHYVLGEAIERDPFLLFELRGRTKVDVLGALRVARGGERARTPRKTTGPTGVKLGALEGAAYDRPAGPWPILHLTFEPPSRPGSLLAQLGRPESWRHDESPAALLGPTVRAASERARRIALAESVATANDGER